MLKRVENLKCKVQIYITWFICSHIRGYSGITDYKYEDELVVSITSYPERIMYVDKVIKSLLIQNRKPNRIVLWLSESQFPNKEDSLPYQITKLKKYGLQIAWCEDLKSYKKLIPTLKEWPSAVIVTADDDTLYRREWLEQLYETHLKYPDTICAHRITKFIVKESGYEIIPGGNDKWDEPCFINKPTGVGGILYPKSCFSDEVLKSEIFMSKCATNDDIWFWLMGALNGRKVVPVENTESCRILTIKGSQVETTLSKKNDHGENLFWKDFNNMLSIYPQIDNILRSDYFSIKTKYE